MKRPLVAAMLLLLLLVQGRAHASPAEDDLVQRRAIRGAPVDGVHETDELRALRDFDDASFPRPLSIGELHGDGLDGASDDDYTPLARSTEHAAEGGIGPDALPDTLRSPVPNHEPPAPMSIPWLSQLQLPDMPVRLDPRVVRYLEFYKSDPKGRAIMSSWLRRQGRYRAMMEQAMEAARMPKALLYVSMIESSYDPHDRSHAGAVGLWQFLPEGARIYGLRVDHYVDERKDPEKATAAVMRYLGDLKARFGTWSMALAAFNAGYGAALRSIHKYNTNDYWELCRHENGLPWETTLYVPKVMATAIVGENRALFGYADLVVDPPLVWDRVYVDASMSTAAIADAVHVPEATIELLNPQLRRNRTPPGEKQFEVHVPRGTAQAFLASYDRAKENVRPYTLRFGERLEDLARSYGMSTKALKTLNGLVDTAEVYPGLVLVVPAGKAPLPPPPCDTVVVAVPDKDAIVAGRKRIFYRALPTDQLADLARFFDVRKEDLERWNTLDADAKLAGAIVLQLWVAPSFDESKAALVDRSRVRVVTVGSDEFFELEETKRGRVRLSYTVKPGDDLKRIGKKFGLTVADMERINRFGEKHTELVVGQKLVVYRTMSAAEKQKAMCKLVPGGTDVKPADVEADEDEQPEPQMRAPDAHEPSADPDTKPLPHLPEPVIELVVEAAEAHERLDKFLARRLAIGVNEARRLLERGLVRVSAGAHRKSTLVEPGTRISVDAMPVAESGRRVAAAYAPEPQEGALVIVHVDDALVVVNKPAGMPTHPLRPHERDTAANVLAARHPECALASTDARDGGFVHRLDHGTTGVLVAARTRPAYEALRASFRDHDMQKVYWALVVGEVEEQLIDAPLVTRGGRAHVDAGGLTARTSVRALRSRDGVALVEATTTTGRLHQVRAHLAHVGHPLVGDELYGGPLLLPDEPQLHARAITLPHPTDRRLATYAAPLPSDREAAWERLLS